MARLNLSRTLRLAAWLVLLPTAAMAQSEIAGQVRDNSGAVLPGVTVEAKSPALIEGTRVVVTDGRGQYSIVSLRPGVYTVTFSLTGFGKVVREGIDLPSNFTATVEATLAVGALEESVTVTGTAPLVDVQGTQRTNVYNREVLDALPTSNNLWTIGGLTAGVHMQGPDVGGSNNATDRELAAHGTNSTHTTFAVDGMMVNLLLADGRPQLYFQDLANQEVTVDTSGGTADVSAGGLRVNMIPRDGGNAFSGQAFMGGTSGAWQGDNLSDRLRGFGLRSVDRIARIFDYAATQGGPIIRDRLWFSASFRYWGTYDYLGDTFLDDGSEYRRIGEYWSIVPRITFQATRANKFALHLDRQAPHRGPKLQARYPAVINSLGDDPETVTFVREPENPYRLLTAKWTSTPSNRVLMEATAGEVFYQDFYFMQPGVKADRNTPEWFDHVQKTDLDRGVTWNATQQRLNVYTRRVASAAFSYVTGTHHVKVGVQDTWGTQLNDTEQNGDITQLQYRSGVPTAVTVSNLPARTVSRLNHDLGIYAQDRWTIDRLTLNGGVRFEWLNAQVDEQEAGAGRFVPARHFDAVKNVPDWFNVSPRFGAAFDLFGDARTALKFSAGRYVRPQAVSLAARLNPLGVVASAIPWSDPNGDDIAQDSEINRALLPANFGVRQLDILDPDMRRETNLELTVGVQHQLKGNVAVSANWYRRSYSDKLLSDNLERDFSDYVPVQIVNPYNGEEITAYDLASAGELSRVNNLITNAHNTEVYNGFDIGIDVRLPGGGRIFGNVNTQRSIHNDCDQRDDPNNRRFCDRANLPDLYNGVPFLTDFKIAGSYSLPLGLQASGALTSVKDRGYFLNSGYGLAPNFLITRGTRYTAADCAGRSCTPGALVIPNMVLTSLTVPLAPAGTEIFLPRLNQLDLGVKKTFRAVGAEWQPRFDVFNVLNVDTELAYRSTNYGTALYLIPGQAGGGGAANITSAGGIIIGRIPRVALQVKW